VSAARGRRAARLGGTLVLDNDAINKAATDRDVAIFFAAALRKQARLVTSSVVLTEILRGSDRDTKLNHVLSSTRTIVEPVTEDLARAAGKLIGDAGFDSTEVVDALVAATAHMYADRAEAAGQQPDVLILTADATHLPGLAGDRKGVRVQNVKDIRRPA